MSRLVTKLEAAKNAVALKAAGLPGNATVPQVVTLFKQTSGEGEKTMRDTMRKLAELAGLLVEGYGLTQEEVAEKVGRSQPWVSNILRWRRDGYKAVAFGPEVHKPKLLSDNKSAPLPAPKKVTLADGSSANVIDLGPKAQEQLRAVGNTAPGDGIEAMKQAHDAEPEQTKVEAPPIQPEHIETAEDIADDALAAFKRAAQALLDFPNELREGVAWFNKDFAAERSKRAAKLAKAA